MKNVDIDVENERVKEMIGKKGEGKKKVLKIMKKFMKKKRGEIKIMGENIKKKDNERVERKGMVR